MNTENRPKHYLFGIVALTIAMLVCGVWIGVESSKLNKPETSKLDNFILGILVSGIPYVAALAYIDRMIRHETGEIVRETSEAQEKMYKETSEAQEKMHEKALKAQEQNLKDNFFGVLDEELKKLEDEFQSLEPPQNIRSEVKDRLFQMRDSVRSFDQYQQADESIFKWLQENENKLSLHKKSLSNLESDSKLSLEQKHSFSKDLAQCINWLMDSIQDRGACKIMERQYSAMQLGSPVSFSYYENALNAMKQYLTERSKLSDALQTTTLLDRLFNYLLNELEQKSHNDSSENKAA